jgi:Flp pilus assembly protein TadG
MNYATQVGKPTAHITKKKSRLKVYNGHLVFLNDKDNFEFELHNPKQKSVLVKIKLNGEYISTGGVVLKPGQRVFLERFLDSNNKFEFSTYEVKDTSENRSAIDLNGDVRIEFYDEQEVRNNFYLSSRTIYGNGIVYGSRTNDYNPQFGTTISTTGGVAYGTTSLSTLNTSNLTYTSSVTSDTFRSKFDTSKTLLSGKPNSLKKKSKSIETGRVEKGDESNQSFTNSYQEFYYHTSHEISFKIQPLTTKNKTTEDIRHYCTECGTKIKSNFKFCPSCGNKL